MFGLFGGLKNTYYKSEAAVIVQNLLQIQKNAHFLTADASKLANELVTAVWDRKPDVFSGKFGQRPHKIVTAAAALAIGVIVRDDTDPDRAAILLSLGNVLSELEVNGRLYPLNSVDEELLEGALRVFKMEADLRSEPKEETVRQGHNHATFDSWYAAYKRGAIKGHPSFAPDGPNSSSLLDFMDTEPLQRAFKDNVDPEWLGEEFGKQFDMRDWMPPTSPSGGRGPR